MDKHLRMAVVRSAGIVGVKIASLNPNRTGWLIDWFSRKNIIKKAYRNHFYAINPLYLIVNKKFVDNFLRVEKWLGDTPPIPGALFKQWIKDIYQDNLLIQNKMHIDGNHIDLKKIDMPVFTQVAVGDHLVSPECSMPLHYAVGSEDKTLRMYPTGHVGMIASSLSQKKVLPELGQWLSERS